MFKNLSEEEGTKKNSTIKNPKNSVPFVYELVFYLV